MDQKKQIEEMVTNLLAAYNGARQFEGTLMLDTIFDMAKYLVNKYQPKIPEHMIVISRDNYNRLTKDEEDIDKFCRSIGYLRQDNGNTVVTFKEFQDYVELQIDKASKETAEKCYYGLASRYYDKEMLEIFRDYIVKEFGITIKE